MSRWTAEDIPDLTGRRALVTGASSGLGLVTARELTRHGAAVLLGVRDVGRGEAARAEIVAATGVAPDLVLLDLADLSSIESAAESVGSEPLDLLVNNAGVMAIPRRTTADGFEMQLGTNHLGHVALTLRLLPALAAAGRVPVVSRVVTVASNAHKRGRLALDDLMGERSYSPWQAYNQSKLANLLFTFELQRRLEAAGLPVMALAAHPGYAATNLFGVAPTMRGNRLALAMTAVADRVLAQSADQGALPQLYAATAPGIAPAAYVGPDGIGEWRGHPRLVEPTAAARNDVAAALLWDESERLVDVRFDEVVAGISP